MTNPDILNDLILNNMLNNELFDNQKDVQIARLKMKINSLKKIIEDFKKYDSNRKEYYKDKMIRLGTLEAFMGELSDSTGLEGVLAKYKDRVSYLEQLIHAKKIQEDLSKDEAHAIIMNKSYKEKCDELQKRVANLMLTIDELTKRLHNDEK